MVSSTFQSPGMNNLDSHLSKMEMIPQEGGKSGAAKHSRNSPPDASIAKSSDNAEHGQHQQGYMLRHALAANYELTPGYLLGPVLGFSEPFSGRHDGQFLFDDPQLRFTILDLFSSTMGQNHVHSSLMISAYVPASDSSQRRSSRGALSIAGSPRMHFRGTPYSMMTTCSVKSGLYGRSTGPDLISSRLSNGIQGDYKISRQLESGLMLHSSIQIGPETPVGDVDAPTKDRGSFSLGLMPSLKYQPTQSLSFTPRLNWYLDQPIRTTTVSVAAMMRLI